MPFLRSVRLRTLVALLGLMVALLIGLGAWADRLLGASFERVEAAEAMKDVTLVHQRFLERCAQLLASAVAWNRWSMGDETMEAREIPLPGDASLFLELRLGQVPKIGRAALTKTVPVNHLTALMAQVAPIAAASDVGTSDRMVISIDGRLLLVVWQHLTVSDGSVGAVVAGRWLDKKWVERFSDSVNEPVQFRLRTEVPFSTADAQALDRDRTLLQRTDNEKVIGHALVDLPGGPMLVSLSLDRGIVAAGGVTRDILLIVIVITGGLAVVAVILFERMVLRRITRLGRKLSEITQTNDHASLVDTRGDDEIASLGAEINHLLASQRGWRDQISRRNASMRMIFDTLPIGLLTLDPAGRIQPDRSTAAADLLGRSDLDGADLGELVSPGTHGAIMRRRLADHLAIVRSGTIDPEDIDEVNPLKIVTVQHANGPLVLRLRFYRIENGSETTRRFKRHASDLPKPTGVLVTLTDISDERRLAAEVERSHSDYEQLKAMAEDVELFHGFLQRIRAMVQQLSDLSARMGTAPDRVQLTDMQRGVRALRSGGGIFGLAGMEQAARSFDSELTRFLGMANLSDGEVRRCRYGVADMEAAVIAIERQFRALLGAEQVESVVPASFNQRQQQPSGREELRAEKRASLALLAGMLFQPVRIGLAPTTRMVVPMARRRQAEVRFSVQGEEVAIDQSHLDVLNHVLPHLLRFAIDQGLDSPAARAAAGKPMAPMLTLGVERRDRVLVITVADDGGGIDPARMRAMAVEQGLIREDAVTNLDDAGAQALVFSINYDNGDHSLSGARSVGLNLIVKRLQDELHADVTVQSVPGQGTVVTISIPLLTL